FETAQAIAGRQASIHAKMNSLEDRDVITALYQAADAGVNIQLNVRGICCLKPRKNIEVISIVDQHLEHMRILSFRHGGKQRVFITSADWMRRNLCKRVELMLPVRDEQPKSILLKALDACFRDNTNASRILADGTSERVSPKEGEAPFRMQSVLTEFFTEKADAALLESDLTLEPHLPKDL
ncbi:polyphosphate kinase 1, partial [Akkermansiaceae bacterium]|nr:polyphosphate kinase 1 [Akkermansiaceae bacterium]